MNLFYDFFNIFFPENCVSCKASLKGNEDIICLQCFSQIPLIGLCNGANSAVEKIFWGRVNFEQVISYAFFEKEGVIQHLLHELKYRGRKDVGFFLGQLLAKELISNDRFKEIDIIIPIPLHISKLRLRGYNQSEEIAKGISDILKKPIIKNGIVCVKMSDSQTKKTRFRRWENVVEKYQLQNINEINNKHILLVDDVITTGATMEACSNQLLSLSNTRLSIASVAFTK